MPSASQAPTLKLLLLRASTLRLETSKTAHDAKFANEYVRPSTTYCLIGLRTTFAEESSVHFADIDAGWQPQVGDIVRKDLYDERTGYLPDSLC